MTPLLSDLLIFGGCAIAAYLIGNAVELLNCWLDDRKDER